MSIERLGSLDPLSAYNKNQKVSRGARADGDSVSVSSEARVKAEVLQMNTLVHAASDVRMDKVEAAKLKLQDPNYINDTLLNSLADRLMDSFGIN